MKRITIIMLCFFVSFAIASVYSQNDNDNDNNNNNNNGRDMIISLGYGLNYFTSNIEGFTRNELKQSASGIYVSMLRKKSNSGLGFYTNFYISFLPISIEYNGVELERIDYTPMILMSDLIGVGGVVKLSNRLGLLIGAGFHSMITILEYRGNDYISDYASVSNFSYGLGISAGLNIYLTEQIAVLAGCEFAYDFMGFSFGDVTSSEDIFTTSTNIVVYGFVGLSFKL